MWARRFFFAIQFPAALALPIWLLIGRGVVLNGPGWEFVLLLFVCPILTIAMVVVAALIVARKSVRQARAVSVVDAAVLGGWFASVIVAGVMAHPVAAIAVIVFAIAGFWVAVYELITETRMRVSSALSSMEFTVSSAEEYAARTRSPHLPAEGPGAGTVIRVDPPTTEPSL